MSNFRLIDRDTGFLMPPSVDEWLPERLLARFAVEVIEGLDLRVMTGSYRGSGEASYHPQLLLGLLICGHATGVFSSRKLERAIYDSVAFRFIAANQHPDHDTIAVLRRRFVKQIEPLFVQVLSVAREMGILKMGTVALDGTKIHANASRHSALSYEHATKIEAQLQAEVADLMAKAEAADQADVPDGMAIPEELARREQRLAAIARAKSTIEARAKERHAREQADHAAKLKAREAKAAASGKKPGGRPPAPPVEGPRPTDQVNLADEESHIMPMAVLSGMKRRNRGRIVNIASAHGLVASPFKAAYVAAKQGVLGLTKAAALEVAETAITCNAVCPEYVRTPLVDGQIKDQAKAHGMSEVRVIRNVILASQPNKRFVGVDQLAGLVLFLCSDAASSITGAALPIEGGWTARQPAAKGLQQIRTA